MEPTEKCCSIHVRHLFDGWRFHVDVGFYRHIHRRTVICAECANGNQSVLVLKGVDCWIIRFAVGLCATDDPSRRGGRLDFLDAGREFAHPFRRNDGKVVSIVPRCSCARRCKYICPGVQHLHKVISGSRVWKAEHDRFFGEVEPRERVECVGIWAYNRRHGIVRKRRHVAKLIQGGGYCCGFRGVRHNRARDIH